MEKLDPKAFWIFFFNLLLAGFFIALAICYVGVPLLGILGKSLFSIFWWVILFFIIWIGFSYFWAGLSYNAYKYELTEDAFKKEQGVIWKRYVSIPYERIQNVDIYRGVIARILGLSDLMIQTAGYSAGYGGRGAWGRDPEGRIPGLSKEKAEELREELIKRAKGTKSGV